MHETDNVEKEDNRLFNKAVIDFLLGAAHAQNKRNWNSGVAAKIEKGDLLLVQKYSDNPNAVSNEDKQKIIQIMRQGFVNDPELAYRLTVYNDNRTVLVERLDMAYGILQRINQLQKNEYSVLDQDFLRDLKASCETHLKLILNVKTMKEVDDAMRDRQLIRDANPDYIPGKIEIDLSSDLSLSNSSGQALTSDAMKLLEEYQSIPETQAYEKLIALAKLGHMANQLKSDATSKSELKKISEKRNELIAIRETVKNIDVTIQTATASREKQLEISKKGKSSSERENAKRLADKLGKQIDELQKIKDKYQKEALSLIQTEMEELDNAEQLITANHSLLDHIESQVDITFASIGVPTKETVIMEFMQYDAQDFDQYLQSQDFETWLNSLNIVDIPTRWPLQDSRFITNFNAMYMKGNNPKRDNEAKIPYYNFRARNEFRVLIQKNDANVGRFMKELKSEDSDYRGIVFSSTNLIAHEKKGYCAFTINTDGEISMFAHHSGNPDEHGRVHKHSSMNGLYPVIAAGEVAIDDQGALISINDHSGHYQPTPEDIYRALKHFQKQGINIDNVRVDLKEAVDGLTSDDPNGFIYNGKKYIEHFDAIAAKKDNQRQPVNMLTINLDALIKKLSQYINENNNDTSTLYFKGAISKADVMIKFFDEVKEMQTYNARLLLARLIECKNGILTPTELQKAAIEIVNAGKEHSRPESPNTRLEDEVVNGIDSITSFYRKMSDEFQALAFKSTDDSGSYLVEASTQVAALLLKYSDEITSSGGLTKFLAQNNNFGIGENDESVLHGFTQGLQQMQSCLDKAARQIIAIAQMKNEDDLPAILNKFCSDNQHIIQGAGVKLKQLIEIARSIVDTWPAAVRNSKHSQLTRLDHYVQQKMATEVIVTKDAASQLSTNKNM